jgi:hypothetical protein
VSAVRLLAAGCLGAAAAAGAAVVVRPTRRLPDRIRPYTVVARAALGLPPDSGRPRVGAGSVCGAFGLPLAEVVARGAGRVGGLVATDDGLRALLDAAGRPDVEPESWRMRAGGEAVVSALAAGLATGGLLHRPLVGLAAGLAGATWGATRARRRLEREIAARAAEIRRGLYTVNQLLALHARAGAGPMQAVQRVVARGHGAVIDELRAVVDATRQGVGETEAFRRAAARTPEPAAARTYSLLAVGTERGADLARALRALSDDLRDSQREERHREAVRRRAAMLVPTIGVLAPIMLLFIAAPLPSIVLGSR